MNDSRAVKAAAEAMAMTGRAHLTADLDGMARAAVEAVEPLIRADIAEQIEAVIVADVPDRYRLWPCRCLDGEKCYPHACHEAMNRITARCEADDEGVWPVIQAAALWDELEPLILRAAAAIARGETPVSK